MQVLQRGALLRELIGHELRLLLEQLDLLLLDVSDLLLPVLALGVLTPRSLRHGCLRFQPVLQCLGRLLQGRDLLLLLFNLLSLLRHILGVLFFERFDLLGVAIECLPDGREQLCLVSLGGLRGSRLSTAGRLRRPRTFSRRRLG